MSGRSTFPGDPPVRADGRCSECGKEKPAISIVYGDPFCSTDCARRRYAPDERELEPEQDKRS